MKNFRFLIFAVILVAFCGQISLAYDLTQLKKPTIVFRQEPIKEGMDSEYVEIIRDFVIHAILETRRVDLVNLGSNYAVGQENETSSKDADFIINLKNIVLDVEKFVNDSGAISYKTENAFELGVIDAESGKFIGKIDIGRSRNFINNGFYYETFTGNTPHEAMYNSCNRNSDRVKQFIKREFPATGRIFDVGEDNQYEVKTLYVRIGENPGVRSGVMIGDNFEVRSIISVAGRRAIHTIGKIKIESVDGEEIFLAKVEEGGDRIKKALDDGQTLIVVYYEPVLVLKY